MIRTLSLTAVVSLALILAGCSDDHASLRKKSITKMSDLATALEGVKDADSSKAAASKVKSIVEDLQELKKKDDALPKMTDADEKAFKTAHEAEMEGAMNRMGKEVMRIAMDPKVQTTELQDAMNGLKNLR